MACFKFARHLQILQILNIDRHLLELFLICKDNSLTRPANVSKHVQKLGFTHICEQTKYTAKYVLQIPSLHTQVCANLENCFIRTFEQMLRKYSGLLQTCSTFANTANFKH